MFKKPVCRLGPGSRLARLRDLGLRTRIKIASDLQQPPIQAPISQLNAPELGFGPVFRVPFGDHPNPGRRSFTEPFSRLSIQRIHEYPFDRRSAAVRWVLPSSSLRFAHRNPIRRPVTGPFKPLFIDKRFHQHRLVSVAPSPIRPQSFHRKA